MVPSPLVVLFFVGWTHILLYGFNAVLFVVGMYLLRRRKARKGTMFLVISSSILFILATVSAVVNTVIVVGGYLSIPFLGGPTSINLQACSIIQFILIHLVDSTAFTILVYRCFHIWGRRYIVIVLPVMFFLGETGVYYSELRQYITLQWSQFAFASGAQEVDAFMTTTFPFTTASTILCTVANILPTSLIAARMWSLKTRLQDLALDGIGGSVTQKYNSIIGITLESGMIIPTFFIIYTVFDILDARTGAHRDVIMVLSTIMPQVIATAPLIIMLRVGLGLTVERHNTENSTLSSISSRTRTSSVLSVNVHRDVSVSVSVAPPSESENLEGNSVSKGLTLAF